MRKLIRTVLALAGLLMIVTFAVANRQAVEVSFWPTPFVRDVPIYGILLVGIVIGVLLGAISAWLSGHRKRATLRSLRDRTGK